MPGSPCLSKTGPVYGPFFFLKFLGSVIRLVLSTCERTKGSLAPYLVAAWSPTPPARDNIELHATLQWIPIWCSKRGNSLHRKDVRWWWRWWMDKNQPSICKDGLKDSQLDRVIIIYGVEWIGENIRPYKRPTANKSVNRVKIKQFTVLLKTLIT